MGYFEKSSPGKKAAALLTGVGIGAAIMYVFDPERGKRRRALVRDKAVSFANQTGRVVAKRSRDIGNRAKGLAAEIRSASGARGPGERSADNGGSGGYGRDRAASRLEGQRAGEEHRGTEPDAGRPGGL